MSNSIVTLAHNWVEGKHNPVGMFMSEKLDGVRAVWDGRKLVSRNNKPLYAPDWWLASLPSNITLDGELWLGRGSFQKVVSVVRKHNPDDQEWSRVKYMVFDVVDTSKPWKDRFIVPDSSVILPVVHYQCSSLVYMTEFYSSIVDNGGEGIMLRDPSMPYVFGRSYKLLKVKPELECVARVVNYLPGEGKYTGMIGALICKTNSGIVFNVGSGLTDSDRSTPPVIGSIVKIKYASLTDGGKSLRFPRIIT